jgi:DNA-directed RNA polymerase subunit E'/Rpb7
LKNYIYDPVNKNFNKNKKNIKEGDNIKVTITGTKYSKQNFSCFGIMIEED